MSEKSCPICHQPLSPTISGRYCYLHRQLYDSLIAEFTAIRETSKGSNSSWKEFLSEKKNSSRSLPKELDDVIKMELENP
jgi:hypothetical protein